MAFEAARRGVSRCAFFAALVTACSGAFAGPQNLYWDGTGTTWNTASFWSTSSSAATPDPAAKPGSGDIANFNISTVNTSQTLTLDALQFAQGLVFSSTGNVVIQPGTGTTGLGIGSNGISITSPLGADTINANISISAAQAWTNGSGGLFTVGGNVSSAISLALTVNGTGSTTMTGVVSGPLGIVKSGTGTLTLGNASNSFTGGLTVQQGTVLIATINNASSVGVLGNEASVTLGLTGGINGRIEYTGATASTNMAWTIASGGSGTIQVDTLATSLTLSGAITASGDFHKSGLGALILSNAGNSFAGFFFIDSGVVQLNNAAALGSAPALAFNTASNGTLVLNSNSIVLSGLTTAPTLGSPSIQNGGGSNATLTVNLASGSNTYAGVLQDGGVGTLGLIKSGNGLLALNGNNTFTGGVVINAGTLQLGNPGALNSTTPNTVVFSANSTGLLSLIAPSFTISNLATNVLVGSPVIQNGFLSGAVSLILNNSINTTYAGALNDGSPIAVMSINKNGPGTLTLSGINTYTGSTGINAGTLVINSPNALGSTSGSTFVDGVATLDLSGQTTAEPLVMFDGANLTNSSVNPATVTGNIAGPGGPTPASFTVGGSVELNGSVTGIFQLIKTGSATLRLSGSTDNASLSVDCQNGQILLMKSSSPSVHAIGSDLVIDTGFVQLAGTGGDQIANAANITLNGGGLDINGLSETAGGRLYLGNGTLVNTASSSSILTLLGGIGVRGNGTIAVDQSASSLTVNGDIVNAIAGTFLLTKYGSGTVVLNGNVNFTGTLAVSQGTLILNGNSGFTGTITITPNLTATTVIQNGSLAANVVNSANFIYNAGAFGGRLTNAGNVTFNADFTAGNGLENDSSLTIGAGRTIILFGMGLDNEGVLTMAGGAMILSTSHNNLNNGIFTLNAAVPLQLGAATLINGGSFNLAGGLIGGGALTNVYGGTISGPGIISSSVFSNSGGTVAVQAGATIHITPAFANTGAIQLGGTGASLTGGAITNGGAIQGAGNLANAVTNNGSIEATGGTLNLSGAITNGATGTIRTAVGTEILMQGEANFPANAGLISLVGGTFDNGGQTLNNTGQIVGYGVLATGGLTNNGTMILTGGTSTINGPVTNAAGKTINIKYQPAIFTGFVTNNGTIKTTSTTVTYAAGSSIGGTYTSDPSTNIFSDLTVTPTGTVTGGVGDVFNITPGTLSNGGSFTSGGTLTAGPVVNTGTLTLGGTASMGALTGSGSTTINPGGTATAASIQQGSLTVNGGVKINPTATPNTAGSTSVVSTLVLGGSAGAWTGQLDLGDNALVIRGGGDSNAAGQVHEGMFGDHKGITSSTALSAVSVPNQDTTLGYALASQISGSPFNFEGQTVSGSDMLIKYTWKADTNLDGVVNITDLGAVANHYGQNAGLSWFAGDLNGDGVVNITDLGLVANEYGRGATPGIPLMSFSDAMAMFPQFGGSSGTGSVPEPGSLGLLGLGIAGWVGRRRRKQG